jgi:hypothetical protein
MRTRIAWFVIALTAGTAGVVAFSLGWGQEGGPVKGPTGPAYHGKTADVPGPSRPAMDVARLTPFAREMYLSAQAGASWLARGNGPDGRFVHGIVPDLNVPLEGDHFLRQVGAAYALARAAHLTGDARLTVRARQAVVTLLFDTTTDPHDPAVRYPSLPSALVNRLAGAGLLVLAINELPSPADDLLAQSEQLCAYIRKQQQPNGSLTYGDSPQARVEPDGINYYPGQALYALMLSQRHRPAAWKTKVVQGALRFYLPWWREHKSMAFVPWHTAAYTEAYLLTRDKPFAEAVTEMNDWLGSLQYLQLERLHPFWIGGFMGWADGKAVSAAPDVGSASYAESLANACRLTHQTGDLQRYQRYRESLELALRFQATLQYTTANTQHFVEEYRPQLLGAFHASHQEGSLRIDYTQQAVCALVQYLRYVVETGQ